MKLKIRMARFLNLPPSSYNLKFYEYIECAEYIGDHSYYSFRKEFTNYNIDMLHRLDKVF